MAERRGGGGEPRIALDKVAFLTAFVPYLIAQDGPVPVAEAAAHFGYGEEFVRRSARQLTVMGLPGDEGAYLPNDLFDIDWDALEREDELVLTNRVAIDETPRLSAREAAAIIAGLELLGQDPLVTASPDYASLRAKLVRSAAAEPDAPAVGLASVPNFAPLRTAIAEGRRVRFRYRSAGAESAEERVVEPLRIEAIDADYHLRAWCLLRGDFRTFRLDRIDALEPLEEASVHAAAELDAPGAGFAAGEGGVEAVIAFDAAAVQLVDGYRPAELVVTGESARMTVVVAATEVVRRILAEVPGARVLAPAALVDEVAAWTLDAVNRYVTDAG